MGSRGPIRHKRAFVVLSALIAGTVVLACNALSGIDDFSVDSEGGVDPQSRDDGGVVPRSGDATTDANADVIIEPPKGCFGVRRLHGVDVDGDGQRRRQGSRHALLPVIVAVTRSARAAT